MTISRALAACCAVAGFTVAPLAAQDSLPAPPAVVVPQVPPAAGAAGRIVGRVLDRETGRPISGARVQAVGTTVSGESDLDGRYRLIGLPPRLYTLRVALIGYRAATRDSVVVLAGAPTTSDFALEAVTLEVEGITVEAAPTTTQSSEASLLAIQQAAPTVSDGVSAEAISRAPDSDAADAVRRVTGISVVDNRFVVVRGLPERYSNTLLNGAELVSPEPLRRVVPLDIFPASLLEAVVTTKTASPDRPGDFSGGSVEIRTKEFPEEFVAQVNTGLGYNSLATFERLSTVPRRGTDWLGFGMRRRRLPTEPPPTLFTGPVAERFAESIRNVWTPVPQAAPPNPKFEFSLGGQTGGSSPLGFVVSGNWSARTSAVPERLFSIYSDPTVQAERSLQYTEATTGVEVGGLANFTWRIGSLNKIAWRNLYTRSTEETVRANAGFDTENSRVIRQFQVAYVEQDFFQTQLAGEHQTPIWGSRFEWRATRAFANRDEPDNRQATYQYEDVSGDFGQSSTKPAENWVRFLDDRITSGQFDWSFPFGLRGPADALFKFGALSRVRNRNFRATFYRWVVDATQPDYRDVIRLPPELAFTPENVGGVLRFERTDGVSQSYDSRERVSAGYLMLDAMLLGGVRFTGGARYEDWRLDLLEAQLQTGDSNRVYARGDLLWSSNLTFMVGPRTNLRLAGFRSVSRPDAREVSNDAYQPVAGDCSNAGNPALRRASILNLDARYEFYRTAGEIVSVSSFYKRFNAPIVETIDIPGGGQCRVRFANATAADNYGLELEFRRSLDLLGGFGRRLSFGVNLTVVSSAVTIDSTIGVYDAGLDLQGQSPWLLNASLVYSVPERGLTASLLGNYFADRIKRYGRLEGGRQGPNVLEEGRFSLDGKVSLPWGRTSLSVAATNLTDAAITLFNPRPDGGRTIAGYQRVGVGLSIGVGYGF